MTEIPLNGDGIMDFVTARKIVRFKIDGELFEGVPEIPGELMLEYGVKSALLSKDDLTTDEQLSIIKALMGIMVMPESFERLVARLRDRTNPLTIETFMKVMNWLFTQYAGRPTTPDSDSSDGSGDQESGTNSTESVPETVSTSSV